MNHSNNNNHHNNTKPYSKLPSYNNAAAAVSNVFKQKEALPVEGKKQEIIEGLRNHDELIIVAETGAGKSTEVPQYLCEA